MPAVDKLLLEEALQDSPQTRSLLSVFEEDAGTLTDYTNQLLQAMQRVYGAQNEMCLATHQLSKQLLAYEKQNFALGKGDEEVISTLHYFAKVVDEVRSQHGKILFDSFLNFILSLCWPTFHFRYLLKYLRGYLNLLLFQGSFHKTGCTRLCLFLV